MPGSFTPTIPRIAWYPIMPITRMAMNINIPFSPARRFFNMRLRLLPQVLLPQLLLLFDNRARFRKFFRVHLFFVVEKKDNKQKNNNKQNKKNHTTQNKHRRNKNDCRHDHPYIY